MGNAATGAEGMHWYAIWTRSRHERVVQRQLTLKQIEAFLPTVTRRVHAKARRQAIDWPLFPGYCFARFDGANPLPVLKCAGVVNIVSFDGRPAPVSDNEVENLRVLMMRRLEYDPCPLLKEGALVRVISGPLQGVRGRLAHKDARRASVVLAVDLIAKGVQVRVSTSDIALE